MSHPDSDDDLDADPGPDCECDEPEPDRCDEPWVPVRCANCGGLW